VSVKRTKLQDRYELREILGRGGMGIVYKAYDRLMNREVALKTILDIDKSENLSLFYKEWSTLATMVHPNVINIYDIGEFEQDGITKPFFVMPLLPGVTLDKLIKEGSPRLSVKGVIEIVGQAAHGLHAAHDQGLIHRDIKPSNIFVMDDGSVKLIDFGIARAASSNSTTTLKGTVFYLAPEQLELKPASSLSDQFALGVVTYEALTRRRPFQGETEREVILALRQHSPPPASEVNQEVTFALSQVVHKAMAKQPSHRFYNVREYADALVKVLRNEPLTFLDFGKIKPRLDRAAKSFEAGDYEFAAEVLSELEAEGHLDQSIELLRRQVDQAVREHRIHQMLESARRFFDAGEYPLALRKIQETLELDPNDAGALALKGQVEKQRKDTKISEWIAIARKHLDNQSFRQARDALDNVVKLKPNETEALQLLAEVGRREKEVEQVRNQKTDLYQAAMHAWEKGEVSSALTKLEVLIALDRDMPETDTGRSGTYQSFYNRVHSENNSLKNDYDEARRNLASNNFEAALAICKRNLTKYPNHSLFQALKFDVEERQRQHLSAAIAETDRRVEEEPDLDRRVGILEQALREYPGEQHFERARDLVRDKRDLVNSIVAKARFFEERGQFTEALDQWQILKSIHERHPGLAFEIERLIKRRDQQARHSAKARWVEQADKYLENGDYDRAMKTVERALVEFPGEAELLELQKLVAKNQEVSKQALQFLDAAREASEKGDVPRALEALREAYRLDPRNAVIRTVLVNTLLDQARRSIETNLEEAEAAVQEVLMLESGHAPGRSLAAQIADRKREHNVAGRLAQARRLQTEGDIAGALDLTVTGLIEHPQDARLQQLQATLQRAQAGAQRQPAIPASNQPNTPVAPVLPPLPPIPVKPESALQPEPVPEDSPPSKRKHAVAFSILGVAAMVLIVILVAVFSRSRPHPVAQPAAAPANVKYNVSLHASQAGAEIRINGQPCGQSSCNIALAPGDYLAEATLSGFQTATANVHVSTGQNQARDIALTLIANPPLITVSSDLTQGSVLLNNTPTAQLKGGDVEIPKLEPGSYTLAVQNGAFRASVPLEVAAAADQMPKVSGPIETQGMTGFVVSHAGDEAFLYGAGNGLPVTLDGMPGGTLTPAGIHFEHLAPGSHEISIEDPGGQTTKLSFNSGTTPAVLASLVTNRNLGVLDVETGEDGAEVFLNGEKYRRATKNGLLRMYLPPKIYSIRVQKNGFASSPEQTVDLGGGAETKIDFKLTVELSTLAIHRGVPGSEVWLDGNRIGTVRTDGELSAPNIQPGKHTVAIRNARYKPLQADQTFVAAKTTEIEGKLQSLLGALKIEINPPVAGAHLRLRREGESQDREITDTTLNLPEGSYTVTGSAAGYHDAVAAVQVSADGTANATLALKRIEPVASAPAVKNPTFQLNDWLKTGGWTRDGATLRHRGGDFVVAPMDLQQGTVRFAVRLLHGKRIEWMLGYRDAKNYALFQVDGNNFERVEVVDGKKGKTFRAPYAFKKEDFVFINITVSEKGIVHSIGAPAGSPTQVDNWQPDGGPMKGRFGFHIPGHDEIALSDFQIAAY
jgi:eukaryotic-like serine/threonine-protein kinase